MSKLPNRIVTLVLGVCLVGTSIEPATAAGRSIPTNPQVFNEQALIPALSRFLAPLRVTVTVAVIWAAVTAAQSQRVFALELIPGFPSTRISLSAQSATLPSIPRPDYANLLAQREAIDIQKIVNDNDLLLIGDIHDDYRIKEFLRSQLAELKRLGFNYITIEFPSDLQTALDVWDDAAQKRVQKIVNMSSSYGRRTPKDYMNVIRDAKAQGLKVIAMDDPEYYRRPTTRMAVNAYWVSQIQRIRSTDDKARVIVYGGFGHFWNDDVQNSETYWFHSKKIIAPSLTSQLTQAGFTFATALFPNNTIQHSHDESRIERVATDLLRNLPRLSKRAGVDSSPFMTPTNFPGASLLVDLPSTQIRSNRHVPDAI